MQGFEPPDMGASPLSEPITKADTLQVKLAKQAFQGAIIDSELPEVFKQTYGDLIKRAAAQEPVEPNNTLPPAEAEDVTTTLEKSNEILNDVSSGEESIAEEEVTMQKVEEEALTEEVLEERFPEIESLQKGDIIVTSQQLTIFLSPEAIIEKGNCVILVFDNAKVNMFRVGAGSNLALVYKSEERILFFSVRYTGIEFSHLDKTFFVFHVLKNTN
jgi:hypothetical protein